MVAASSHTLPNASFTAKDAAEIQRLANEIKRLQMKVGNSDEGVTATMPRSSSRFGKALMKKSASPMKKLHSFKQKKAPEPSADETRDAEEASPDRNVEAIKQREDLSLGQKLDLLVFGIDTSTAKSAADIHKAAPASNSKTTTPETKKKASISTSKTLGKKKARISTSKMSFLPKNKVSKSDDATTTSAAPTKTSHSASAVIRISQSLDEATYEARRLRSEVDRLIYEHSVYLDRIITAKLMNVAYDDEDIPMDAFEVLQLGGGKVRVEESTYQREPVLIESAINDVRSVYQEGAEEVSRLCRNQSLIAKHVVKKTFYQSVVNVFSPQTDEVHPKKDFKMIANIRKELEKMEEAATWAEVEQRRKQEEYERAAKALEEETKRRELEKEREYTVQFAPGPLGMKLEPPSLLNDGGTVKEIGCHVIDFSAAEENQARDSGEIRPGDELIEVDGVTVEGTEYSNIISLLKNPSSTSNAWVGKNIKFRRPLTPEELEDLSYVVQFAPGPLGMKLEPPSLLNDGDTIKEMGCHVIGFSAAEANQARDLGEIKPGDVLIEVDGVTVEGAEYSHIIALLKNPSSTSNGERFGKHIKFRRPKVPVSSEVPAPAPAPAAAMGIVAAPAAPPAATTTTTSRAAAAPSVDGGGHGELSDEKASEAPKRSSIEAYAVQFHPGAVPVEELDSSSEAYTVDFTPGPLGMVLEPIAASGETGGTPTECGCHVRDCKNQALYAGVGIGDVIVEIEGTDVSAQDYPYASIIALLKQTSGTKSITFRRKSLK